MRIGHRSLLAVLLLAGTAAVASAATTCSPPDPAPPELVEAVATHRAESRVDVAQLEVLTLQRDSAIAAGIARERSAHAWERASRVTAQERDVARAAADSLGERAAAAPTAADSAVLYAGAYNACTVALDAATLSCAQKDSALAEQQRALAGERAARSRSDSIAAVNLRGWGRADSTLAVALSVPRGESCRVIGPIPCPSRTQVGIGVAILVHGITQGWLRPPDLQLRW